RLIEALVRILISHVFADHVDGDVVHRVLDAVDKLFPPTHAPLRLRQVEVLQHHLVEPLGRKDERDLIIVETSFAVITASSSTSQKSAIFRLISGSRKRSVRHSRMSGWMPMDRKSRTLCCVGLVFSSPAVPMNGTSVRCTYRELSRPTSC